jgi:hypothetical protein
MRTAERSDHALVGDLLGDDAAARERAADALRGRGPLHVLVGDGVVPGLLPRARLVTGADAALLFGGADVPAPPAGVIGVSGRRERAGDARAALAEARTAASLGPALGLAVVRWDRLGAYQQLAPLAGAPLPGTLRRLLDHPDADPLVATLETYLDRAGDVPASAAALYIHRTTLYHRLRRIEAITGADLRDGDDRLALHVGLRIRRLSQ